MGISEEEEERHIFLTNQIVSWETYLEEGRHLHSIRGKGEEPSVRID